jgi:hypothetical protein
VLVDKVVLDVISGTSIGMWNVSSSFLERGKRTVYYKSLVLLILRHI